MPASILDDLKKCVFSQESFAKIEEKLSFVIEDLPIVLADDSGNSYSKGDVEFPIRRPDITALEWLSVEPDLSDD